jgi:hypothetical protein
VAWSSNAAGGVPPSGGVPSGGVPPRVAPGGGETSTLETAGNVEMLRWGSDKKQILNKSMPLTI